MVAATAVEAEEATWVGVVEASVAVVDLTVAASVATEAVDIPGVTMEAPTRAATIAAARTEACAASPECAGRPPLIPGHGRDTRLATHRRDGMVFRGLAVA